MGDDKKKKKKKSKAQLQAELEEQQEEMRLAEEAELRRQEAAELRRREEVALRAEQRAAEAEEETRRLAEERDEVREGEDHRAAEVERQRRSERERRDWDEYLQCNDLPNPRQVSDLNAHLTLWRDEDGELDRAWQSEPAAHLVARVVDGCGTTERVLDLLDTVSAEAAEVNDGDTTRWAASYAATLRGLSREKVDKLTCWILRRADDHERVVDGDGAAVPATASLGAGAGTPAEGAGAGGGAVGAGAGEAGAAAGDAAAAAATGDAAAAAAAATTAMAAAPAAAGDGVSAGADDEDAKREVLESYRSFGVGFGLWAHTSTAHFRRKTVRFPQLGVTVEAPKSVAMLKVPLALRVVQRAYNDVATLGPSSPYVSVGGVLSVEQLGVPAPPKKLKGWKMRDVNEAATRVSVIPYLAGAGAGSTQPQPFRISYEAPANVFIPSRRPKVGWWDAQRGRWREEGITDVRFDHRTRTVSLSTVNLAPLAMIQPRALDFPYRRWSFVPTGRNTAELSLVGSRFEVRIRVEGSLCRLVQPSSSQLAHVSREPTTPGRLLQQLARSGINVAPSDEDALFSRKPIKTPAVEERFHDALSRLVPVFELRGSMWNHARPRDACAVQLRPAAAGCSAGAAAGDVRVEAAPAEAKAAECKTSGGGGGGGSKRDAGKSVVDQQVDSGEDGWITMLGDEQRFFVAESSATAAPVDPRPGLHSHAAAGLALVEHYGHTPTPDFSAKKELEIAADECLRFQIAARSLLNLVRVLTFH